MPPTHHPTTQPREKVDTKPVSSFTITYILLLTTATITFIEAMRTNNPVVRHIFNLETCVSIVASYFYSVFVSKLDKPINWTEFTETRYIDWCITTPIMLLALCVVLTTEIHTSVRLPVIVTIIALNYAMLYAGYLGETGVLDRTVANGLGFIPFIGMFSLIYWKYVSPAYSFTNRILFYLFLIIWSLYGVVYFLPEEEKNIAMNILDLIAKCLVGLGLWVYYVHIVKL